MLSLLLGVSQPFTCAAVSQCTGRAVSESERLLDHSRCEEDAKSGDKDSGNLIEAVHALAPETLRPSDEQPVDDELTLRSPGHEKEQADCSKQASPKNVHD